MEISNFTQIYPIVCDWFLNSSTAPIHNNFLLSNIYINFLDDINLKIILVITLTMPQFLYLKITVIPSSVRDFKFSASTFGKYFQILEWKRKAIYAIIQLRHTVKGTVICFQSIFTEIQEGRCFKRIMMELELIIG